MCKSHLHSIAPTLNRFVTNTQRALANTALNTIALTANTVAIVAVAFISASPLTMCSGGLDVSDSVSPRSTESSAPSGLAADHAVGIEGKSSSTGPAPSQEPICLDGTR